MTTSDQLFDLLPAAGIAVASDYLPRKKNYDRFL